MTMLLLGDWAALEVEVVTLEVAELLLDACTLGQAPWALMPTEAVAMATKRVVICMLRN